MSKTIIIITAFLLSMITALGDAFIKKAAMQKFVSGKWWLLVGGVLYGLTAIGWFFVLKKMKLSVAVIFYTIFLVLIVMSISVFYFKERLNGYEIIGLVFAFISIVLLSKFL